MGRYRRMIPFLLAAALCTGCQKKETDVERYMKEQDQIMKTMMESMEKIPETKSAELDFLYGMIPHHESAVEMSNSYLKYAPDNAEFKKMAEEIASSQTDEITEMKAMIGRLEESGQGDEQRAAAYQKEYQAMMKGHHDMNGDGGQSDLDSAFAEGMAMHHQMAVDMARAVLSYAEDEEVIRFCEKVIEAQEKEIGQMQSFLDQKGGGQSHQH